MEPSSSGSVRQVLMPEIPAPGLKISTQILPGMDKADGPLYMGEFAVSLKKSCGGTSLVAQWLRICLPMQGTPV